jgi:hypothetical protein
MSIVHEAVEYAVGLGGVADQAMPLVDRELTSNDNGAAAVPVLEDLEEIVARARVARGKAPIIEDEEVDAAELRERTFAVSRPTALRPHQPELSRWLPQYFVAPPKVARTNIARQHRHRR